MHCHVSVINRSHFGPSTYLPLRLSFVSRYVSMRYVYVVVTFTFATLIVCRMVAPHCRVRSSLLSESRSCPASGNWSPGLWTTISKERRSRTRRMSPQRPRASPPRVSKPAKRHGIRLTLCEPTSTAYMPWSKKLQGRLCLRCACLK